MTRAHPPVKMYSSPFCGYCAAAKRLLREKGVEFTEINVFLNADSKAEMIAASGRSTVPQIFIGETHVGGFDDLSALEQLGELDPLLEGPSPPPTPTGE